MSEFERVPDSERTPDSEWIKEFAQLSQKLGDRHYISGTSEKGEVSIQKNGENRIAVSVDISADELNRQIFFISKNGDVTGQISSEELTDAQRLFLHDALSSFKEIEKPPATREELQRYIKSVDEVIGQRRIPRHDDYDHKALMEGLQKLRDAFQAELDALNKTEKPE